MTGNAWWQTAVFYQIYPRSFADSNSDGIGDLPGIAAKLDYLQALGIDAIWLSPHYPSPLVDCGYDIAGYTEVAPEYGRLDDFRRLLDGLHTRSMRLILDLVLNHTSDQHPWFLESRSGRDHPKRDWYIWRDGRGDGPPNNWVATFGGPAWELDPATGQYYYHFFFKEQPDLNWRNPEVQAAMFAAARFWLDLGVDGFRLDAIGTLYEDPALPDHPPTITQEELYRRARLNPRPEEQVLLSDEWQTLFSYQVDQPGIHDLMKRLRQVVDEYDDRVLIGETDDVTYYGAGDDELHMVFNFPLMRTARLTPDWVRQNQKMRSALLPPGAWPANTFGNHDTSRLMSRFEQTGHAPEYARLSLATLLTLRGTPFLYNGEELGMTDLWLTSLDQVRDTLSRWAYRMEQEVIGATPSEALQYALHYGRDKCRTPMQWRDAPNAGFSPAGVQTWLPVNPNYVQGVNAEDQEREPASLLNFYRQMLHLRKQLPALATGSYLPLLETDEHVLAFLRILPQPGQVVLVVMNMSASAQVARFSGLEQAIAGMNGEMARRLFSTNENQHEQVRLDAVRLSPFEILIAELEPQA